MTNSYAMKNSRRFDFWLVACLLLLLACKANQSANQQKTNPVFLQTPELKKITDKIHDNPENARLYYDRGLLLHQQNEDSLALMDFNNAVKFDSTKAEYYSAIGDLLFDHKDLSGSVKWIRKAIELNPNDPKAHLKIAKMFIYMQNYPTAFKEINLVLKADAMSPEAYYLKGMIYKELKDSSNKALSSFLTAVQIKPDYKDALLQIGLLYDKRNDSVALKYYQNAFAADSTDVSSLYAKGMFYQTRNQMEAAKAAYFSCLKYDKNFSNAYFNLGYILMQQDSFESAIAQYDAAIKTDPVNAGAYYNRGVCKELLNQLPAAAKDYQQALLFKKDYQEAKDGLQRVSK